MQYFSNNRRVNFNILRECGIYKKTLLDEIELGNYKVLKETLNGIERNNKDFMEPLLYAVRNERNTYKIYKYYGKDLQENIELARDIVKEEPELIEDTTLSNNKQVVLELAEINPKVVKHMSQALKEDSVFIEDLCKTKNKEVIINVTKECDISQVISNNPDLLSNKEFMVGVVIADVNYIEKVDKSLKNNYEFIRETTKENYEIVEYVVKNNVDFGLEAITAAKDTTKEITVNDYMQVIEELSECSDDSRYRKVKDKVIEKGQDDLRTLKWITAMVAQSDKVSPEMLKKVLDYSVLEMSKIKKDLTEEKKEKVSIENAYKLITPKILNRLKEKAKEQGLEIDGELEARIEEYKEFYENYMEKLREKKRVELEKINDKNSKNIELEDVEKVTECANLDGIEQETKAIRQEIEMQRENKDDRKIDGIGVQMNRDDD